MDIYYRQVFNISNTLFFFTIPVDQVQGSKTARGNQSAIVPSQVTGGTIFRISAKDVIVQKVQGDHLPWEHLL